MKPAMCGVKKGRVFIGSQSSHQASASLSGEVTALATVMTRADRDRHTQSQVKGVKVKRSFTHTLTLVVTFQ